MVIVGATGFIGSQIVAAFLARGHQITGVARHTEEAALRMPAAKWVSLDPGWATVAAGADAVVNCAGALQDGPADNLAGTHERGLRALIDACEKTSVRRFIHFSAMGVDRATPTEFSRSKLVGDEALMASGLDWVILRPSVVLGPAAYGASALIRGLAALPLLPVMPDTAPVRPVALDDVVATVKVFLDPETAGRVALDLAGPDRLGFTEIVRLYRQWLGFARPARSRCPLGSAACSIASGISSRSSAGAPRCGLRRGWRSPAEPPMTTPSGCG
jgi:uncharacterized protein YbjT (DUF2867 family)